jgi:redox-sensitive bicupin YhaK (pirin superfamily)
VSSLPEPVHEVLAGREVPLGGTRAILVRRTLPDRTLRTVGPWCFVDHYGPHDVSRGRGMAVPPHPHTGLQTVSWLLEGEVEHRDSVGNVVIIRPGELNLMTSGRGIAHSEDSTPESATLHGVQLWVALPDSHRRQAPHFEHHADLPVLEETGVSVTVIIGELGGTTSPARSYSPIVGVHVLLAANVSAVLPLDREFEHAALLLDGSATVDGVRAVVGTLLYLGGGRSDLAIVADERSNLLLLGGTPFEEDLLMWWNFVGRSHEEIVADRTDWEEGRRFGVVADYPGRPLPAPPLPTTRLRSRARRPL